jgi:hypothetical protein
MPDSVFSRNLSLRTKLRQMIAPKGEAADSGQDAPGEGAGCFPEPAPDCSKPVYVVITTNEINDRHGTGPLLKRILAGKRNVFCIRARDDWGGHDFGEWNVKLPQQGRPRPEWFCNVLRLLAGRRVCGVLCVPFQPDELMTAIAVKEAFGVKLCAYLMDDQNIASQAIPDDLMREFLTKSALRLATHPELRLAYEQKYGLPFYLLPAVVPADLIATARVPPPPDSEAGDGVLLGNFWDQLWFDRLCAALENCGRRIDWYGNNRSPLLRFPPEDLARAGVIPHGLVPEPQLAGILRSRPFAIVPVGLTGGGERNRGVAVYSLPGRILFATATSHIPILAVGSEQSCAARFLRHFGLGVTVPYEREALASAMAYLCKPNVQLEIRENAAAIAPAFSDRGVPGWLERSIDQGRPADMRFENVFSGYATLEPGRGAVPVLP